MISKNRRNSETDKIVQIFANKTGTPSNEFYGSQVNDVLEQLYDNDYGKVVQAVQSYYPVTPEGVCRGVSLSFHRRRSPSLKERFQSFFFAKQ
ncbi:MAG: hypothetical protein CMC18_03600 [Flavobacteriaceae bacterium]|nr:hypothetical protein [Flavobacteriaceae bacterium]